MAFEKQQQRKHIKAYCFRILSQYLEEGIVTLCIAFLLALVVKIFSRLGFFYQRKFEHYLSTIIFLFGYISSYRVLNLNPALNFDEINLS